MGMQQLVGFMAAGLAQEFPVNLLDFGILMRFAQRLGFVLVIKIGRASCRERV